MDTSVASQPSDPATDKSVTSRTLERVTDKSVAMRDVGSSDGIFRRYYYAVSWTMPDANDRWGDGFFVAKSQRLIQICY